MAIPLRLEAIERCIHLIRGHKVMLDADLARFYGVRTKELNKAVGRNIGRFPPDFMLVLTRKEQTALRFQIGVGSV
ncbi:MAG: ORF6N domain-containing protein [Elusimicrobiota bacterium]